MLYVCIDVSIYVCLHAYHIYIYIYVHVTYVYTYMYMFAVLDHATGRDGRSCNVTRYIAHAARLNAYGMLFVAWRIFPLQK